jgi:predicted glycosyltransferase
MRVLCHAPHLSGVGHFVRMNAIARGLLPAHDVHLTDGGRPVPGRSSRQEPAPVPLPRLFRMSGELQTDRPGQPVAETLATRAQLLEQAAEGIRPDIVLIDHYPFSKWELEREMATLIQAARRATPWVHVVCSLRDIVRKTRFEPAAQDLYEERVLALLRARFDAVLVHSDPAFTRFEEHFRRAPELEIPVHHTGFVVEPPDWSPEPPLPGPYAVLSCGGGTRSLPFLLASIEAFWRLHQAGALRLAMPLVVFPGPFLHASEVHALRQATTGKDLVQLRTFSPDFDRWLAGSALSISRAGYNTSVRILHGRLRSVLIPDPGMSDQEPRARRLAELGIVTVVGDGDPTIDAIAAGIAAGLDHVPSPHDLDLSGVPTTRAILETLGGGEPAGVRACSTPAPG